MAKGFKHGGTGGASLNFKIVRYDDEVSLLAATPVQNTIGVITETEITSYAFIPVQPSEPSESMVWIVTGAASAVEFNVLKKNALYVYPTACYQYVSGAWERRTAKIWQGGVWLDWAYYLYNAGDECEAITGGWQARGWATSETFAAAAPSVTKNADSVVISCPAGKSGVLEVVNDIDVTEYSTLNVKYVANSNGYRTLLLIDRAKTYCSSANAEVYKNLTKTEVITESIDISSCSSLIDIALNLRSADGAATMTMYEMWLEK